KTFAASLSLSPHPFPKGEDSGEGSLSICSAIRLLTLPSPQTRRRGERSHATSICERRFQNVSQPNRFQIRRKPILSCSDFDRSSDRRAFLSRSDWPRFAGERRPGNQTKIAAVAVRNHLRHERCAAFCQRGSKK